VLAIETLPSISPSTNTTIWKGENGYIRKEKQKNATTETPL
jgi:hypothetical protein